jgi:cytochrome P450
MLSVAQKLGRDRLGTLVDLSLTYGEIVHARLGLSHLYVISNPDYIHQMLVAEPEKFQKSGGLKRSGADLIGEGLLTTEGEVHKRQRKLVQPAFHATRIAAYSDTMIAYTDRMMQDWQAGHPIEIHHAMMALTLNIIAKTMFDADVSEDIERLGEAVTLALKNSSASVFNAIRLPRWIPSQRNRVREHVESTLNTTIRKIIEDRRRSGDDKGDLLSMLLLAVDEEDGIGMSDRQAQHEAMTLFLAGHETTANALTWTWYLLAQHPEIEAKLLEELDRVLGGRKPTITDLANLPYTDYVIKEAIRLYPPAWMLVRRTVAPVTMGGFAIPVGSFIFASPYIMHHSARYFPQPDRFLPERWENDLEKHIPRYSYFPFGGGPRVCIGQAFAQMEARLILAEVAQCYHFDLLPGQAVGLEPLITLRPDTGIQAMPTKRESIGIADPMMAGII